MFEAKMRQFLVLVVLATISSHSHGVTVDPGLLVDKPAADPVAVDPGLLVDNPAPFTIPWVTKPPPEPPTTSPPLQPDSSTYVIVAPQIVRANSVYDVSVTIRRASAPVTVDASLRDAAGNILVKNYVVLAGGESEIIQLQIPETLSELSYTLFIYGTGGLEFKASHDVEVKSKNMSIFIQTDKAMYKPGQMVLFRVIAVRPDLKPYTHDIDVVITDISGNRIVQWLGQHNDTGVFSNSLQLADQTPLGTWKITATVGGNSATKTFDVAEYVLPLFDVKVELPSYYLVLLTNRPFQEDLWIKVSAIYTYGQPVKGRASVNVSISANDYEKSLNPYKLFDVELVQGSAKLQLNITDILGLVPIPQYYLDNNVDYDVWQLLSGRQIVVSASVTETVTGKVLSDSSTVQCTPDKYTLSFLDITPTSFKPGLTIFGFLQLQQFDGSAPQPGDIQDKVVNLEVTCNHVNTYEYNTPSITNQGIPIPSTGFMSFSVPANSDCESINFQATFDDQTTLNKVSAYRSLEKFQSRDGEGIQITLVNGDTQIAPGQVAAFSLRASGPADTVKFGYQLLSKGILLKSGLVSGWSSTFLNISVDNQLAQQLAPTGRLVAWYVTALGEIVSDSLDFSVTGAFANEVSVSFSADTVQPADGVSVNVRAYKGSYIGLLAVDQSVLLLKSGNDITQDQVLQDLSSYDSKSSSSNSYDPFGGGPMIRPMPIAKRPKRSIMWWWPFFSGGTSTSEVFDNAGVFVLTDAYIYEQQYYYRGGIMPPMMADAVAPGAPVPAPVEKGQSKPPTSSVRQNFPETWLWSELTAGLDGSATLTTTVPDTITSWILTAFAVSSTVGLGIAPDSAKLTVFKPFFVSVNLPYSVIRGEEFALQVTIFNYLPEALKVVVILQQSDDFKVRLNEDMAPQNQPVTAFISVPSNDAVSVYFWMIPVTLGQIPIEVSATSGVAADAVKVNLLVKPEGVSQEYSTSVFFSLSAGQTDNVTLAIALPLSLVPGSEYFFVTAIGDLLGQSLSGLGKLLNMPYGCGEQTMLSFAPDVYVLKYLKVTGQDHGTDGDNARKFILDGYQRELTFQREDGSFSAFGDSDLSGSVWLSAFVIKCFHEAKEFIPWDDAKIAETLDWLSRKQAVNGSFAEPVNGRVIHSDMQGGSAGGLPMTAYVLISLLENADNSVVLPPTFNAARDQAVAYLEYQLNSVMSDPYALSLICYAFTMANSSLADTCLGYLNALAINKDGMKYWHKVQQDNADEWVPPYQQARAVDIEMTAYALLTYTLRNDFSGGVVIAKWLVSQRNSLGGFSSTQDTVVALQALTRFAALTSGSTSTQNLLIHMTAGRLSHEFSITAANALVLQSVQIPSDSAFVNLQVSGAGVGLVQLNVRYNIFGVSSTARRRKRRDATTGAGFKGVELSLKLVEVDDTHLLLTVCASRLNGNGSSGMSIVDVGLLTGYVADNVDDLKNQGGGVVRRVDVGKTNLAVYLDELIQKPLCLRVLQKKVLIVDKIQPAVVTAYLYYDPGQRDTLVYKPVTKNVSFCDQCPDCCNHQLECETGDDSDKLIYKVVEKPNRPKRPPGKLPVLGNTIPDGVVTYVYRAKLVAKGAGSLTFSIHAIWPLESYSANNPPEAQLILDINLLDASLIPVSDLLVGGTYIVSGPHDEDNNYNVERLIGA